MINKKFSLKNKFCLITGAAGLLGLEHAKAILEIEGNIILTDKDILKLKKKIKELKFYFSSSKIYYYKMDVTKPKEIRGVLNKLVKNKIDIDILINNAAIDSKIIAGKKSKTNKFESFSLNEWEKQISVGLTGSMLCSQVFGSQMSKRKKGVILNISSDLGIISPNQNLYKIKGKEVSIKPVTYSIIKHGIIGLTKYTATNWAKYNIRCNAICPGGMFNNQDKYFLKKIKNLIPMNRMAKFKEFNSSVVYLVSDASSYVNGHSLVVDGGRSIW